MTDLNRIKHLAGLQEDSVNMEKHNTLNDMYATLEKLNSIYDELESLDRDDDSSGVGDLTDQLTTMRKHIQGLYMVLDRSSRVVPMEGTEDVKEAEVPDGHDIHLLKAVADQMQKDIADGDYTAIDDLLKDIPEETLKGFLSEA